MPRIAGTNIPDQKQIEIALTHIYGIGRSLSRKILKEAGIKPQEKVSGLKAEEINRLRDIIEKNYTTEGDLRRRTITDVKRLKEIGCWRGMRHRKALPVRGQRTKTNSRTVRGNVRKTVGSGKRPAPEAT